MEVPLSSTGLIISPSPISLPFFCDLNSFFLFFSFFFSSDAIAAHGFAHELANYGEYSGAPNESQTYEYSKTILGLMTRGAVNPQGKILIIGGGIANFTNVADTFKGIARALKEVKKKTLPTA